MKHRVLFLVKSFILIGIIFCVFLWLIGIWRMSGNYMFPSVRDGDLCVFSKIGNYTSGDVVFYQTDDGVTRVGRIVATSGQSIDFFEMGGYIIDGEVPDDKILYPTFPVNDSHVEYPIQVKDGQYFVLNDFRMDTADSREIGALDESQIKGKLIFVL